MSWFSSLFQAGTGFYGDPFPPIISVIEDFGWSLLPQFPGSVRSGEGGIPTPPRSDTGASEPPVVAPVPVGQETGSTGQAGHVYPVRPGPEPGRPTGVSTEIVVVGDVATKVERHPQGDFPAGSIFAPGQTWGSEPGIHLLDREEPPVAIDWGSVLDWGLDTIAGQQPWQLGGIGQQQNPATMGFAAPNYPVPVPSGIPGQPTTITGYSGGRAVTNGDCGNRRYVTLDRETGKISCKRRRRRRLLTNRDLADLASLKTITGGGAALNAAVIRAVR